MTDLSEQPVDEGLDQLRRQHFELQLIRRYLGIVIVLLIVIAAIAAVGVFGTLDVKQA